MEVHLAVLSYQEWQTLKEFEQKLTVGEKKIPEHQYMESNPWTLDCKS